MLTHSHTVLDGTLECAPHFMVLQENQVLRMRNEGVISGERDERIER